MLRRNPPPLAAPGITAYAMPGTVILYRRVGGERRVQLNDYYDAGEPWRALSGRGKFLLEGSLLPHVGVASAFVSPDVISMMSELDALRKLPEMMARLKTMSPAEIDRVYGHSLYALEVNLDGVRRLSATAAREARVIGIDFAGVEVFKRAKHEGSGAERMMTGSAFGPDVYFEPTAIRRVWRVPQSLLDQVVQAYSDTVRANERDPAMLDAALRALHDLAPPPQSLGRPFVDTPMPLRADLAIRAGDRVLLTSGAVGHVRGLRTISPEISARYHGGALAFLELEKVVGELPRGDRLNVYDTDVVRVLRPRERAPTAAGRRPVREQEPVEALTGARVYFTPARKPATRDALLNGDLSSALHQGVLVFYRQASEKSWLAVEVDPTVRFLDKMNTWPGQGSARWPWAPWEEDMVAQVGDIMRWWRETRWTREDALALPLRDEDIEDSKEEIVRHPGQREYAMFTTGYGQRNGYAGIAWSDRVWLFDQSAILRVRRRLPREGVR